MQKTPWQMLDGHKTQIAHAYWAVVVPGAAIWWPAGIPVNAGKIIAITGIALTAFGYGHKAIKAKKPDPPQ